MCSTGVICPSTEAVQRMPLLATARPTRLGPWKCRWFRCHGHGRLPRRVPTYLCAARRLHLTTIPSWTRYGILRISWYCGMVRLLAVSQYGTRIPAPLRGVVWCGVDTSGAIDSSRRTTVQTVCPVGPSSHRACAQMAPWCMYSVRPQPKHGAACTPPKHRGDAGGRGWRGRTRTWPAGWVQQFLSFARDNFTTRSPFVGTTTMRLTSCTPAPDQEGKLVVVSAWLVVRGSAAWAIECARRHLTCTCALGSRGRGPQTHMHVTHAESKVSLGL